MGEISLKAEKITQIFGFPITNALIMSWATIIILLLVFYFGTRKLRLVPRGLQNVIEAIYEEVLSFIDLITGERSRSEHFFGLSFTLLIFILTANWLGILPGVGSIGFYQKEAGKEVFIPLARSANSDLNMTLALALISVIATHIMGARLLGFGAHIKKYFDFSGPIQFFVGILELVGEFAKIISFSFRLFGNIFAGEVLLIIIALLSPFIAPIPFLGLELFVGLIQAIIFATLTLVFLNIAASEGH